MEWQSDFVDVVEPIVADHGAELVDVEISGSGGSYHVRVLVYREKNGVTVDLCEAISREVSDLLDAEDPVPDRYRLEVTSPGLDRPLISEADFQRASGRHLKVVMANGRTRFGRLVGWTQDDLHLEGDKGTEESLERTGIAKATIQAEF
ncbi:MAG: ribosome maturation factor RimP [Candidatus Latescibacterota bacterium]|nr:ribosome maturation factor RimP [Candidatus Latescibacterota bacterium]